MARNDVYLNINALSPADAVVTGQQDMTAATVPELVLGDTPTFNFYFTDNTNVWPSWAGNAAYTVTWALSDAVSGDFSPAATTGNATPITGGWSVVLPLNAYDLVGLLNTKRVSQPYPVTNLWQQIRVADPSGNEVTRAMFWTPIRYRAISDTQNTESASPTGGREVTVDNVNVLTTPTAAQFYAANPVPTSALGSAANGELLIGNGTGFTKATLTAGTGVSITNGSGSITISATDGDITLDDGTAASPSLHFTNDADTGIYRPAANTLGISVSGTQVAYFDENGLTVPSAGVVAGGSFHGANGNANNPSLSFSGDQDTGFFRHQPNEIGIALGGTQYATLTSTTFSVTPALSVAGVSRVTNSTASSSTTTGALVVTGGVGIGGAANVGGNLTVSGTGTSSVAGRLQTGAGVANSAFQLLNSTSGSGASDGLALELSGTNAYFTNYENGSMYWYGGAAGANQLMLLSASGNLTVSGTGTSSVAGNWFVGTTTAAASGARIQAQLTGTDGTVSTLLSLRKNTNAVGTGVAIDFIPESTDVPLAKLSAVRTNVNNGYTDFRFSTWNGSALVEQLRLVGQTGNFLIGTTTDSGNGKLQLATHTTSAGGIGFGTDFSLYRYDIYSLALVGSSGAGLLRFGSGGVIYGQVGTSGTSTVLQSAAGSVLIQSAGTTALTLDNSQNATLAGNLLGSGTGRFQGGTIHPSAAGAGVELVGGTTSYVQAYNRTTAGYTALSIIAQTLKLSGNNGTSYMELASDGNATFAGSIAIGNTVNTVSPTSPNRTITMVIGGTTYYIHAKTTND